MSTESNAVLQLSLAQNERVKGRQLVAFGVLFVALVATLLWIGRLAAQPTTDLRELILWAVIATVVAVIYGVMVLAIYINRTMARLLCTMALLRDKE